MTAPSMLTKPHTRRGGFLRRWSDERIARRITKIDHTVPQIIRNAMSLYDTGARTGDAHYLELELPFAGLSDAGVQSFTRLSIESSLRIDTLMANMRVEYPDWYIYTDASGMNRDFSAIRVHRKADA